MGNNVVEHSTEPGTPKFFWNEKHRSSPWMLLQFTKAFLWLVIRLRLLDRNKSRQAFKQYTRATRGAADIFNEKWRKRTTSNYLALLVEAWKANYIAWVQITAIDEFSKGVDEFYENFDAAELAGAIQRTELALERFDTVVLNLTERSRKKRQSAIQSRLITRCPKRALLHITVAGIYSRLYQGDVIRNLEMALRHYESALNILESEYDVPEISGLIMIQLGNLLLTYPTEYPERNAQRALELFLKAKQTSAPYATILAAQRTIHNIDFENSVGFANIWQFVTSLSKLLFLMSPKLCTGLLRGVPIKVQNECIDPSFMSKLESGLGLAYYQLQRLDKAVEHFDLALQALPTVYGWQRADIQLAKGLAYFQARSRERVRDLALATRFYKQAEVEWPDPRTNAIAEVRNIRAFLEPEAMALVKPEERTTDLDNLASRLRVAVHLAGFTGPPVSVAQEALFLLGKVYALRKKYRRAYRILVLAIRMAERLDTRARTPLLKSYLLAQRAPLYELVTRVALEYLCTASETVSSWSRSHLLQSIPQNALSFVERGRTRFLQEQLASRDLLPNGAAPGELAEFFALRQLWLKTELQLLELEQIPRYPRRTEIVDMVRKRRNALESRYLKELASVRERFEDPSYDPDQPIEPARYADVRSLIDLLSTQRATALIEYYITDHSLVVFIVLPGTDGVHRNPLFLDTGISHIDLEQLAQRWLDGYARLSTGLMDPRHWESGYLLQTLDRLRQAAEVPTKAIETWEEETHTQIARVIVIPHRFLHLVPLHAIKLHDGTRWGESVSIQYAPSASVLWRLLGSCGPKRTSSVNAVPVVRKSSVLAISYSPAAGASSNAEEQPLLFNTHEVRAVVKATGGTVLQGLDATPSRVIEEMRDAAYVHFACHGVFKTEAPLEGGLKLAPESGSFLGGAADVGTLHEGIAVSEETKSTGPAYACLTLGQIFERVHLSQGSLVVLGACETGVTKVEELRDEYIGLPAGFLYAGAGTVISTLWKVSDLVTWLLTEALVDELAAGFEPADALRRAQVKLRQMPSENVIQKIAEARLAEQDVEKREEMIKESRHIADFSKTEPFPFAGPRWWAGFIVSGLGTRWKTAA